MSGEHHHDDESVNITVAIMLLGVVFTLVMIGIWG